MINLMNYIMKWIQIVAIIHGVYAYIFPIYFGISVTKNEIPLGNSGSKEKYYPA